MKTDIKTLLEFAGVDTTQGKAKLLCEANDGKTRARWEGVWKSGKGMFVESKDDEQVYYITDAKRGSGSAWQGGLWDVIEKTLKASSYSPKEQELIEDAISNQDSPFHLEEVEWNEIVKFLSAGGDIEDSNMESLADQEIEWGYNHADDEIDD